MSDEVPLDVTRQFWGFGHDFLHIVLAEMALAGIVGGLQHEHGLGLGDCHQSRLPDGEKGARKLK